MIVKNLLDIKVQIFNTVNEPVPNQIMTVRDALQYGNHYKGLIDKARLLCGVDDNEYKATKMRMFAWLPTALISGDKSHIVHTYPVLCIDIDKKDNPDIDVENIKQRLIELPFIYYAGLSIGGQGIFALAYIDDVSYYQEHFNAMKDYMLNNLGLTIDSQCGNTNRLRFMSYDNNPCIKDDNDNIKPFCELKWSQPEFEDHTMQFNLFFKPKSKQHTVDLLEDDNFCYAVVDFCIDKLHYQSGGRTTGWMQDLSACKSLTLYGEDLALRISRQSSGYVSDSDVLKTFYHKGTYCNRNGLTKFFKLCKEHFAIENRNWIYAIKELYGLGD